MGIFFGLLWVIIAICCFIQILKNDEDLIVKIGETLGSLFIFAYGCLLIYDSIHNMIN